MSNLQELKNLWNKFVAEHGPKSGAFLQSFEWGEFQKATGRKVFRFLINADGLSRIDADSNADIRGSVLGVVQVIKMPLTMGRSYLYVPRGPIFKNYELGIMNDGFIDKLSELARKERAIFVKTEFPTEENDFNKFKIQDSKFKIQYKSIQPKDTLMLDLEKSEEELLAAMHEKTRYNIRLAEKKGVQIRWSTPETAQTDLEKFWKLAQSTAERDKFSYHHKDYYSAMLHGTWNMKHETQGENLSIKMVLAEKDGEVLAANIVIFFAGTVTYLHGASNYEHRDLMAPHLLQWRAIQEAKKLGCKYYDFWGVSPPTNLQPATPDKVEDSRQSRNYNLQPKLHPWAGITRFSAVGGSASGGKLQEKHPWAGITRFKLGFGGEQISYAPTIDLPISKFWYNLYKIVKKLRH